MPSRPSRRRPFPWPALLTAASLAGLGRAQCSNAWLPGDPVAGTNGPVHATALWDPDGSGPATALLVVGGEFQSVGSVAAENIAAWDPATGLWQALGSGLGGRVHALAVRPNGELVATGAFTTAGGLPANHIAAWNGGAWAPLGAGLTDTGYAAVTLANGEVVVGGRFTFAGGAPANRIARWNGTAWSSFGSGCDGDVLALATTPSGAVVAGGRFTTAGGVAANAIARWSGTAWSALGAGLNADVQALLALPNGDVIAGGFFTDAGGVPVSFVARCSGTTWSPLGSGFDGGVTSLVRAGNGDVIAGGLFSHAGAIAARSVARWNGTAWAGLGAGVDGAVRTVATLPNGSLVVGGEFVAAGGVGAAAVARWDGAGWSPLTAGTNGPVLAFGNFGFDLVAAGSFTTIGGVAANGLARWNGSAWSAISNTPGQGVTAVAVLSTNLLAVAVADYPVFRVARWDGIAWTTLATFDDRVSSLVRMPGGQLVAGGNFRFVNGTPAQCVAIANGPWTSWSAVPGIASGNVVTLGVMQPNWSIVAGGTFTLASGVTTEIAEWNGSAWTALGPGSGPGNVGIATCLTGLFQGDMVAGGFFPGGSSPGTVLRRTGGTWQSLGGGTDGPVAAMGWLPNGDLVVGGSFTTAGGMPAEGLARWNGTNWAPMASGAIAGHAAFATPVHCLTVLRQGELVVGGELTTVGGVASAYLARARTTCPALAVPYGIGCPGTISGPAAMQMIAGSLPWLGTTFSARTYNVPWFGFAVGVLGLSMSATPMPSVLPQGVAGCTLYASPDLLTLFPMGAASTGSYYPIPNAPALAQAQLFHQLVALETPNGNDITAVTSSNGLALTIGVW